MELSNGGNGDRGQQFRPRLMYLVWAMLWLREKNNKKKTNNEMDNLFKLAILFKYAKSSDLACMYMYLVSWNTHARERIDSTKLALWTLKFQILA